MQNLFEALSTQDMPKAIQAVHNGAHVHAKGRCGRLYGQPLTLVAGSNNNKDLMELLLDKGAHINEAEAYIHLSQALFMKKYDLITYLLVRDADFEKEFFSLSHYSASAEALNPY